MVILYAAIREKKLKLSAKLLWNLLVRDWKECFKNQFKTGFRQLITWHLTKFLDWQLLVDRLENGAKFFNFVVVVLCKITPWLAKKKKILNRRHVTLWCQTKNFWHQKSFTVGTQIPDIRHSNTGIIQTPHVLKIGIHVTPCHFYSIPLSQNSIIV